MGGFNRDIGVGIAIALDGKIMQKLRQPLNRRRVIKLTALCLLQFSLFDLMQPNLANGTLLAQCGGPTATQITSNAPGNTASC
jgi:hypothetical protein